MIEAHGLSRRYGTFEAVRDVSFAVADGEILGILGPNGAGKTTTIRMVTGFLPPTAGRVTLEGHDVHADPTVARRHLGYLPESVALYPEMRVGEYLQFRARLHGIRGGAAARAIDRALDDCLLREVERQIIGTLSKGYRQRVGLAAAILHEPAVLVLDEPTVGLDPRQIVAIRELIRRLGRERTLLLSTHHMPEVEALCDRVLIIDRGRILTEGTPSDLRSAARGHVELTVTVAAGGSPGTEPVDAREALERLEAVESVEPRAEPGRFVLRCRAEDDESALDPRAAVFHLAVERGWLLLESAERRVSLEDAFVRLVDAPGAEEPEAPEATAELESPDAEPAP